MGIQYLNGEGYKTTELNFIQKLSLNVNCGEMNLSKNSKNNKDEALIKEIADKKIMNFFWLIIKVNIV